MVIVYSIARYLKQPSMGIMFKLEACLNAEWIGLIVDTISLLSTALSWEEIWSLGKANNNLSLLDLVQIAQDICIMLLKIILMDFKIKFITQSIIFFYW